MDKSQIHKVHLNDLIRGMDDTHAKLIHDDFVVFQSCDLSLDLEYSKKA